MLIFRQNQQDPSDSYLGIKVAEWKLNGMLRSMLIVPYITDSDRFVEVDIICHEDAVVVKVASTDVWPWEQPQRHGFGEESAGYPLTEAIADSLYFVWDDGATVHPARAQQLFLYFELLIATFTQQAQEYLDSFYAKIYEDEVQNAISRGWNPSLIVQKRASFPRGSR